MAVNAGIGGANRELSDVMACVGGVNRSLSSCQACVGGVNRELLSILPDVSITIRSTTADGIGMEWDAGMAASGLFANVQFYRDPGTGMAETSFECDLYFTKPCSGTLEFDVLTDVGFHASSITISSASALGTQFETQELTAHPDSCRISTPIEIQNAGDYAAFFIHIQSVENGYAEGTFSIGEFTLNAESIPLAGVTQIH